jgi:ATP-dependent DNA helicase HFM1/MER3
MLFFIALREITFRGTKFEISRVACILAKCVSAKLWEKSKFVSKLIPKIGPVLSGDFVLNGKTTWQLIKNTDPRDIERVSRIIYACVDYYKQL